MASYRTEIDWDRLDKTKFFVGGAGLFSGVTTMLYPLSVIKTRQMVTPGMSPGLKGAGQTLSHILKYDGVPGLYRGFGTTIFGSVPVRGVYLTVLEIVKSGAYKGLTNAGYGDVQAAAAANFIAGASASVCSQSLTVPLDVVSQRLMVHTNAPPVSSASAAAPRYTNGIQAARAIIAADGIAGLYRGLGASLATYMPASAVWWSAYGTYQKVIWHLLETHGRESLGIRVPAPGDDSAPPPSGAVIQTVQTTASVMAGLTSGVITNPLDVVKTRIQVAQVATNQSPPSFSQTLKELLQQDGAAGLMRGVVPKMANTALWSTCMVSVYEFLKRLCALDPEPNA